MSSGKETKKEEPRVGMSELVSKPACCALQFCTLGARGGTITILINTLLS